VNFEITSDNLYLRVGLALRVKLLRPTARAPQYMTAGAAGADVFADFGGVTDPYLQFGGSYGGSFWHDGLTTEVVFVGTAKIPLGIALEIPPGWVGLLKGRSGLAAKGHEAHVAAIDSDYRGEACMLLHVADSVNIRHGDRVGQILFVPAPQFEIVVADELSETARSSGGFGSTGSR
jgi:dUTP pyrophosphatase